jgi:GT2 family glycosyltransferase
VLEYNGRQIDLIVACLESIVARSTYKNVEFVIVDNGDFDRGRLKHIGIRNITFVTYALPEVNIAKKINLGASRAKGDFLIILNDDIEVLADDWIERMLAHFEKPHVGVVGGKLLYPGLTIQHAGVVMCGGDPEHVRRGAARDDLGYAFSTCCARNYLAVTGAMAMVRARDFWSVGGYSEDFPIDFNDIDFCLKLHEAGRLAVYEPGAELIHYESVSVVKPPRPQDHARFHKRWAGIASDPFYNEFCFTKHPATHEPSYSERRK